MSTPTLRQYMETCRTQTADWNLTGLGGTNSWLGKYNVPEEEYEHFLNLVNTHIFTNGRACSLLEKHRSQSPILIDLDFKYVSGGPLRRRFTNEQLREFVEAYAAALHRFFDYTEPLEFFVMLKPAPEVDAAHDQHKDGVHIVCPTLTTVPDIQYALRGYLLQTGVIEHIFGTTGNVVEPQDCFDISVIHRNNWFLYGACKPDKAWYKVTTLYKAERGAIEEQDISGLTSLKLLKSLSIRFGHDNASELILRTDNNIDVEWIQLLQRYGKGKNWAKTKTPSLTGKAGDVDSPPDLNLGGEMVQIGGMSVRAPPAQNEIKLAYKLVEECLNPGRRVGNYHDWVRLGLLLHNIAPTEESYTLWCRLSRKVPKYKNEPESGFKTKWALLPTEAAAVQRGVKPLTVATIHHYAKEDNLVRYTAIMDRAHIDFAILNCSGTHVSVADLIFDMFQHEFRCTPLRKGASAANMDWFQYLGHTWKNLKSCMRIREKLSNEVRTKYLEAGRDIRDRIVKSNNQDDRDREEDKLKKLNKLESSLQTSNFKDSVMKELAEKFYHEEFLQHMNQNPSTLGFCNGVLDLRHEGPDGYHVRFRPGQPDDCISFEMGRGIVGLDAIPFLEGPLAYNPNAPAGTQPKEYAEIMEFFRKIYPDPVLLEYCLTLYAACLEGANREQKFYILTGGGSNGKSKIVELLSKTFGEYQETIGTTALTRKRPDSGAANPDLVVLKCKRFVSMSEPDEGEKINTASMKQLSGEDIIKARALFQDQDQFVIMARIFMLCNDLPPVSSMDNGTWRRLRVIPHVAKFVDSDAPIDPANHVHYKDMMLDGKIARWRPFFASILVWYFEHRYLRDCLVEPPNVKAASEQYKEENDSFVAFFKECFAKEHGVEAKIPDIMERYAYWKKENTGKKDIKKDILLKRLTEVMKGPPVNGKGFAGLRIVWGGEDTSGGAV